MITASDLFVQKLSEPNRQFYAQLVDSKGIVITGSIRSITVSKGACGEDTFSVGSIYSSFIEVVMDDCNELLENEELLLQIGLVTDNETETTDYIDIGYYTVTKPKRTVYQMSFIAVGRIASKFNCPLKNIPWEKTLSNVVAAIEETTGVSITCRDIVLEGELDIELANLTCMSILKVIVDVLGGFATEDSSGNVVICKYDTRNIIEYDSDDTTMLPEFNDYDYTLSGVEVIVTPSVADINGDIQEGISYKYGDPIRQTLIMPHMTESLFYVFAENVIGYTYRPGTVHLSLGDPRLEPWDCIEFTDVKGNVFIVPCLNITHTFDGGISTTITAPGSSAAEEDAQVKGPITIQLENIKKDTVDMINSIEVGGTNLIRNSHNLIFEDYYFGKTLEIVHDGENVLHISGVEFIHDGAQTLQIKDVIFEHDGDNTLALS